MQVIITSPSLDPNKNVSGISAVTQFIIDNNKEIDYVHFEQGRKDGEQGGLMRIKSLAKSLRDWKSLMKKYPNAIVHYNFPLELFAIIRDTIFLHYTKGHRTIIHIHGGNYLMADRIPWLINLLLRHLFTKDVPFVVLSELEKAKLQHDYNVKDISVLPNCPDLNDAKTYVRLKNLDKSLTIGYLGRICKEKGMQELLDACRLLKEKNIDFKLRIAGKEDSTDFIPMFQKYLGVQFEYCGIVSGKDKSNFLKSLDIFILPSYYEGLPMSLLESMGFGVVPICTNVGSIGEVVEDGKSGLFIKKYSSQDIAKQIEKLYNKRNLIVTLSSGALNAISEKFDSQLYIDTLNELYTR